MDFFLLRSLTILADLDIQLWAGLAPKLVRPALLAEILAIAATRFASFLQSRVTILLIPQTNTNRSATQT